MKARSHRNEGGKAHRSKPSRTNKVENSVMLSELAKLGLDVKMTRLASHAMGPGNLQLGIIQLYNAPAH